MIGALTHGDDRHLIEIQFAIGPLLDGRGEKLFEKGTLLALLTIRGGIGSGWQRHQIEMMRHSLIINTRRRQDRHDCGVRRKRISETERILCQCLVPALRNKTLVGGIAIQKRTKGDGTPCWMLVETHFVRSLFPRAERRRKSKVEGKASILLFLSRIELRSSEEWAAGELFMDDSVAMLSMICIDAEERRSVYVFPDGSRTY